MLFSLELAHVSPDRLDARDFAGVDRLDVAPAHIDESLPGDEVLLQDFRLNLREDLLLKLLDPLDELRPELVVREAAELVKFDLVFNRPDEGAAVSVYKVAPE